MYYIQSKYLQPRTPVSQAAHEIIVLFHFRNSLLYENLQAVRLSFYSSLEKATLLSLQPVSCLHEQSEYNLPNNSQLLRLACRS